MPEDKRDLLDKMADSHKNWTGEEFNPDTVVERFQLFAPGKRIEALEQLDTELNSADTSNLKRYTKLTSLRRDLGNVHHNLRKVNR
jgi:hypothetical protein